MPANRPLTYDHLKSKKKPTIVSVQISLDDDLQEAYGAALDELGAARARAESLPADEEAAKALKEAEAAHESARKAAEAASVTFKFRSIGRKRYDALVDKCPPTQKQKDLVTEAGGDPDNLAWDADKFPMELVVESVIEPEMTREEVIELWDSEDWSASEINALTVAALEANTSRRIVDLGKG